ncbi:MAG: alpha/beta fold hydrolase [Desulfococcaceae bacterium]
MVGEFVRLRFSEQLDLIADDLDSGFRTPESILVGKSYGGYLLLHALADLPPFPGRILLFSPVLGEAVTPNRRYGSRPPRPRKLLEIAESGTFPPCGCLEVHTGEADPACDPDLARNIIPRLPNASLRVVPGAGHELDLEYVGRMFLKFIGNKRMQ